VSTHSPIVPCVSRATPLPPAARREAILDAVLPLVLDQGRALSTKQIAEASGIAEGTIFRVFESKSDLIDAAICRALSPEALLAALNALADRGDLRTLVIDIVRTLQEHAFTTHRLISLLPPADGIAAHHGIDAAARRDLGEQTVATLAALMVPHTDALAVTPSAAAGALLALSFGSTFSTRSTDPAGVADILLHGISRTDLEA
jgi:AcrR family transcriptional regulator